TSEWRSYASVLADDLSDSLNVFSHYSTFCSTSFHSPSIGNLVICLNPHFLTSNHVILGCKLGGTVTHVPIGICCLINFALPNGLPSNSQICANHWFVSVSCSNSILTPPITI